MEAGIDNINFSKIPYKDYIADINNNNLSLIFLDLDRIKNINFIKNNILKIKKKESYSILIPVSKNKAKLSNFINAVERENNINLILINIFKLGIKKVIEVNREKLFKTFLSVEAQIALAQTISNIITLLKNKDMRLLSIDLDNTCWTGVIGEDGLKKIYLDQYQKKSLSLINKLISKTGLVVSIHSKNTEEVGIKGINKKLTKYPNIVKKTFKYINWDPKIKSIKKIVKIVNFSKNNVVFLDDNISEIKQVNKFLLNKNCFWIKNSYYFYLYSLSFFISNINKEKNVKRFKDIKSNILRNKVAEEKGIVDYIKNSKIFVEFTLKNLDLKRCAELSNKTNQFNSNFQRLSFEKLKMLKKTEDIKVISFSVCDKYSDSGIISNIILKKQKSSHEIIEFTMSCRALGRGLECFFLDQIIKKFSIENLIVKYIKTDRNEPFIKLANNISYKKNKNSFWINIKKVSKNIKNYEKFIKTKIN